MACVAYGCKSHSSKKNGRERPLTFHRFPEDEKVRDLWTKAVRRDNWQPTMHSRICSDHFEEKCYVKGKRRRLLCRDAVPTLFENYPTTHIQMEPSIWDTKEELDSQSQLHILEKYRQWTANDSLTSNLTCETYLDDSPRNKLLIKSLMKEKRKSARRLKKLMIMRQKCRSMIGKIVALENVVKELQSKAMNHKEMYQIEDKNVILYVDT